MLNIWWKSILEYSLPGKSTCTLNRHCGCWFWGPKFFLCSFPENSLHLSWLQSFFCTCLGLKGCVKYRKSSLFYKHHSVCKPWGISLPVSNRKHGMPLPFAHDWTNSTAKSPSVTRLPTTAVDLKTPWLRSCSQQWRISSEHRGFILTAVGPRFPWVLW